ncbi:MAG TPA: serine/threonine-protein kinase [Myxococcales bacterium]|nr:serine/threonine-protein kinase [Myxococcales bacterium]
MQLGRYRLEEQVGQGGMAVVWRGFDTQLRRTVAVKVLHPHLHAREDIRRRFDREAQAVARLHHPHILDVYDFSGLTAEPSYLVTEFIRGRTLREFAEAHRFDPPELAAACLLPIAEALQHAHAAGVVHRDVKPENVMVRDDGVVKLTDFGIAALLDPGEKFTMTGSILGSPAHLAPETIEGKPADPRSDLFSFGTILYWLSCGELPFQAPSPAALLRAILDGNLKDPRAVRSSVSDAQAKIIAHCLERDPARRYQSASDLRADLESLLAQSGIEQPLEVVTRFVRNPEEEAARVRAALVARCLARGEEELSRKRTSAALAAFGRVLALDPQNQDAKGRVDRIRRRARLLKLGRRALIGAAAAAITAVVSVPAIRFFDRVQSARDERDRQEARAKELQTAAGSTAGGGPRSAEVPAPHGADTTGAAATNGTDSNSAPASNERTAPGSGGVASSRSRDRSQAGRPETRLARAEPQKPLSVVLAQKVPARVIVDGVDLGQDLMIPAQLTAGLHRVTIQHRCCADLNTQIEVRANRQRYTLETGAPKPAELKIVGGDPDAQVWYSDENTPLTPLGLVRDLTATAARIAMTQPVHRFTITVGDKPMQKTLQAGTLNQIDMTGEP